VSRLLSNLHARSVSHIAEIHIAEVHQFGSTPVTVEYRDGGVSGGQLRAARQLRGTC
jgi:hypothetical protein